MKSKGAKFLSLPPIFWFRICSLLSMSCCSKRGVKYFIYSAEVSASSRTNVFSCEGGACYAFSYCKADASNKLEGIAGLTR